MPDSFPFPQWGQQSFDDRDLDSLLAGNAADIPDALRPVADTLNALRAAPSARELHGEGDARAQFRAQFQGTLPLAAVPGQGNPISGEIPAVPLKHGGRRPRGSARRTARVRFAGLMAAAGVIVLGAAVTYTGHLPGPMQQLAHDTIAAPSPKMVSGHETGGGVQTTSARPAPANPAHPASGGTPAGTASKAPGTQDRQALCDAFWTDLEHPRPGPESWQTPRYQRLITAAGGQRNVFDYCYPVWDPQDAGQYPTLPAYPPYFPRQWDSGDHHGNNQPGNENRGGNNRAPSSGSQDNGSSNSGSGASTPSASASSTPPPSPQTSANSSSDQQQQQQSTGN